MERALAARNVPEWAIEMIAELDFESLEEIRLDAATGALTPLIAGAVGTQDAIHSDDKDGAVAFIIATLTQVRESDVPLTPLVKRKAEPIVHKPQPKHKMSKLEEETALREQAERRGLKMVQRMRRSSWIGIKYESKEWSEQKTLMTLSRGVRNGPYMEQHIARLEDYMAWCIKESRDPWCGKTGAGPSLINIEDFLEERLEWLKKRNLEKPDLKRKGSTVIRSLLDAFTFAQSYLGLSEFPRETQYLETLANCCEGLFGSLPDQAIPLSVQGIKTLEHIVAGDERQANQQDRFFAACCLVCVYAVRRWDDIQHFTTDTVNEIGKIPVTAWKDKTVKYKPKWASISVTEWFVRPWIPALQALSPPGWRDHLCPRPEKDYSGWLEGTEDEPQKALSTKGTRPWIKRLFSFPIARDMMDRNELKRILRGPRTYMFRRAMGTMAADAGGTSDDVNQLMVHRQITQSRDYIDKSGTQQVAIKAATLAFHGAQGSKGIHDIPAKTREVPVRGLQTALPRVDVFHAEKEKVVETIEANPEVFEVVENRKAEAVRAEPEVVVKQLPLGPLLDRLTKRRKKKPEPIPEVVKTPEPIPEVEVPYFEPPPVMATPPAVEIEEESPGQLDTPVLPRYGTDSSFEDTGHVLFDVSDGDYSGIENDDI